MAGKFVLKVTEGPLEGHIFSFEEHDTLIFGRADHCRARLSPDDKNASRNHFLLEVNPPNACLRDLGSLNGTYVNGKKYGGRALNTSPSEISKEQQVEVKLNNGDKIQVGRTKFVVEIEVATVCIKCKAPIPEEIESVCKFSNNAWICLVCRDEGIELDYPGRSPSQTKINIKWCRTCGSELPDDSEGVICASCLGEDRGELGSDTVRKPALTPPRQETQTNPSLEVPEIDVPGYKLTRLIGKGGMGHVYLARREKDGKKVAVKFMNPQAEEVSDQAKQVFQREIDITMNLRHRHIVDLYENGIVDSVFYFVMEFCSGGCLKQMTKRLGGKVPFKEIKKIMIDTIEGLAFAHEQNIVHRDIKPQNILLTKDKEGMYKLADFGLAKNFEQAGMSGMTFTGTAVGTPKLMPREQITNFRYTKPVSDVWSIAATFYYTLTGLYPRDFPQGEDPMKVVLESKVVPIRKRNPSVPRNVSNVIDHALQDNSKKRFQSAVEFREAIKKVL